MKNVKTNKEHVITYRRPSTNAIKVNIHQEAGFELKVYPSIQGWYELRPVDEDGVFNTEFIQVTDVE